MFATTLIVFREMLEAALIIGIVLAATRGAAYRVAWVSAGVVAGVLGAGIVAGFADAIASAIAGIGQELFNACVLFLAVAMLGWHNIWMKRHARELTANMKTVGREVLEGARPLYLLAVVVGIAVLREGSETVLFLYGVAANAAEGGASSMLTGGLLGLAGGASMGLAMYFGLLRIPTRHLFTVTSWLILLLSAGMAAQGAGYLEQAGLLPALGTAVWDTSGALSEHSLLGQTLHTLVGYIARPDGIQILFYVITLLIIGGLMQFLTVENKNTVRDRGTAGVVALGIVSSVLLFGAPRAEAAHKIYSPQVEKGELEIEARGHVYSDSNSAVDGGRQDKYEIGYGFTSWWFSSVFAEYERSPGESLKHAATTWENIFQLTEPGKYWLDVGAYFEYEDPVGNAPRKLEAKLLLEKPVDRFVNTANIVVEREIGGGASHDVGLSYAWRTKYKMRPEFEPGIEIYGELGTFDQLRAGNKQALEIGPVITGKYPLGGRSRLGYEVGYLFGASSASPDGTAKWLLEYEYTF